MRRLTLASVFLLTGATTSPAGEVFSVSWKTSHAAPPAKLAKGQDNLLPLIRLGVSAMPESEVMKLTFLSGSVLGLSQKDSTTLHQLLEKRYQLIQKDEVFSKTPPALPYCFSAGKPGNGLATVYSPDGDPAEAPLILFLHGYGGSFSFYLHYLAKTFPDHLIICPAYGISCSNVSSAYLRECLAAVEGRLRSRVQTPLLIGLSAGGGGGFREYVRNPASYRGYICLASFPPKEVIPVCPRDGRIRLLAGGDETFVKDGTLPRSNLALSRRVSDYSSRLIPGQGHFFMLSAEEETKKFLRQWDAELRSGR